MAPSAQQPVDILLVEDSPTDARITVEAFAEASSRTRVHVERDVDRALSFLARTGEHADAPRPHLVLLDLRLPRKPGGELITAMKADPQLRLIPVVVLAASDDDDDVRAAYDLHANSYVRKPATADGYIDLARSLDMFWFKAARLPSRS